MNKAIDAVYTNYTKIKVAFPNSTLVFQTEIVVNDVTFLGPEMYEEEFLKFVNEWEGTEIVGFVWATDHGWVFEWKGMEDLY